MRTKRRRFDSYPGSERPRTPPAGENVTDPAPHARPAAVVVLAAGSGTRMKSKTMKVLHPVGGRSMIGHVLTAAQALDPQQVVAVVGHQREAVAEHIHASFPDVVLAVQEEQHGTGHA